MRDAESMLDQLLSSSTDELDEARVRDLLGLADTETIDGFVDALVANDALAGIRLLTGLEDRGRDLRGFLDQVIEALRAGIVGSDPTGARTNRPVTHPVTALAGAARRLAAIDPSRAGVGGLRLQLELALFPDPGLPSFAPRQPAAASTQAPTPDPAPAAATPPEPASSPDPAARPSRRAPEKASEPATPAAEPPPVAATEKAAKPGGAKVDPEAVPPRSRRHPKPPSPKPPRGITRRACSRQHARHDRRPRRARERWPEIFARISAHPPTKPLIVVCRPITVEATS